MGWTADWQVFLDAASYLYDVAGFAAKWLRDLAADQLPDRVVWHCAPNAEHPEFLPGLPARQRGLGRRRRHRASASLAAKTARVVDHYADADRYRALADAARAAWCREFLDADGTVATATQADCVRALAFDLVPAAARRRVAAQLTSLIRAAGTHLGTGFLATGLLLPTLAETPALGLAYELLFQDTEPSWLTMIDRGATTVWEVWNGVDADGTPHESLNHYSKGTVISFLHRYVAGIQLREPAYRRFRIAPRPGGGPTWCRARYDSRYGPIQVAWELTRSELRVETDVPAGTEADVSLRGSRTHTIPAGTHRFSRSHR